ncbi:hypothetical protein HIM_09225 [Hirsutella minnesotensis 3608]|uniref:Uncharacterized protein n=1 Tax=Hirsutella minnesotensis 3608 TaxID=1043627 RepID=A0A0F8A384_9HYPO|nr:hypothetical protein HIM_09225 [Hirsutella minnesotensis 3608]
MASPALIPALPPTLSEPGGELPVDSADEFSESDDCDDFHDNDDWDDSGPFGGCAPLWEISEGGSRGNNGGRNANGPNNRRRSSSKRDRNTGRQNNDRSGNDNSRNNNGGNGQSNCGERTPDDISKAETLEGIEKETATSMKNFEKFMTDGGENTGQNGQTGGRRRKSWPERPERERKRKRQAKWAV